MDNHTIDNCGLIRLDRHSTDRLGNLSVVQSLETVPFDIKRLFYIFDVPGGESRGGHAHHKAKQFIVAVSGSFCLTIDDGNRKKTFLLNRPYIGILVESGIWVTLEEFSSGAVALVITSEPYDSADYIRNYDSFLGLKTSPSSSPK